MASAICRPALGCTRRLHYGACRSSRTPARWFPSRRSAAAADKRHAARVDDADMQACAILPRPRAFGVGCRSCGRNEPCGFSMVMSSPCSSHVPLLVVGEIQRLHSRVAPRMEAEHLLAVGPDERIAVVVLLERLPPIREGVDVRPIPPAIPRLGHATRHAQKAFRHDALRAGLERLLAVQLRLLDRGKRLLLGELWVIDDETRALERGPDEGLQAVGALVLALALWREAALPLIVEARRLIAPLLRPHLGAFFFHGLAQRSFVNALDAGPLHGGKNLGDTAPTALLNERLRLVNLLSARTRRRLTLAE
jgi:hypothetical protein